MTDLEFLTSIKSCIEEMEEVVDGEWGAIYSEVISRIKLLTPISEESFDA